MLRLSCNLGIGGAVQTGYQAARELGCDLVVQVDGDGQHDPRELPLIMEPVLDGRADICIGSRFAGSASTGLHQSDGWECGSSRPSFRSSSASR